MRVTGMAVNELIDLRGKIASELVQRRRDLEKQLTVIGSYTGEGRSRGGTGTRSSSPMMGKKVAVTHRGPNGETWASRGMRPKWLQALVKQGHSADKYLVGAAKAAAAARKPNGKKTAKVKARGRKAR